ncbi:MAG TPA: response regulator transcription factor [Pseudonocardiaceae bacterium]|nr:response regulator transcription factor [Pseudonocardiaceae bacterium]
MRVFLVDDHHMVTEALAAKLADAPDVWVVGRGAPDEVSLPAAISRSRPDVITVEVESNGTPVQELLARLRLAQPDAHLVVLTGSRNVTHVIEAARAGAAAWVPKESPAEYLLAVIRAVCQGHSHYPPEYLGAVLRALRADVRLASSAFDPLDVLSDRERTVLIGMIGGKRRSQIAEELHLSAHTVRTHTQSIYTKLGVHSRLAAVHVARSAGLQASHTPPPDANGSESGRTR